MVMLPHRRKAFRGGAGYDGTTTLALRWRMDEVSGNLLDSSTNGQAPAPGASNTTGFLQNAPSRAAGRWGNGLALNGTNQWAVSPAASPQGSGYTDQLLGGAGLSMGVWVRITSHPASGKNYSVAFIGRGVGTGSIVELLIGSTGEAYIHVFNGAGATGPVVPLNTWTHLMMTRVWATRVHRLYVNGVLAGSYTPPQVQATGFTNCAVGNSNPGISYGYTSYLPGTVDDYRLYNAELTAEAVASIAAGTDLQTP